MGQVISANTTHVHGIPNVPIDADFAHGTRIERRAWWILLP